MSDRAEGDRAGSDRAGSDRAGGDGRAPLPPPEILPTQPGPPAGSIRVSLAPAFAVDGVEPLIVEPGDGPARMAGPDRRGRATLRTTEGETAESRSILIQDPPVVPARLRRGASVREVVVDGWRVEVVVESAHLSALRERASRGRGAVGRGGPTEVRAIIPGRVVGVSVGSGDDVVAGQQLLVVEAMKMQNELRAPRDGRIERVAVAVGATIEVGDLLLVLA